MKAQHPLASLTALVAAGLAAGYVGVTAKGQAEGKLQPIAEKVWPPSPGDKKVAGADPSDHPENMPPAVIATEVHREVAGESPDDDTRDREAAILHWVMGLSSAVVYTLLRATFPAVRTGWGAPAGLALYAATHGSVVPALQVQPPPWKMPTAAVAWEAGSHVVYGITVELALRALAPIGRAV